MEPFITIIKTLGISIPLGITFVDRVGYVARVDGESLLLFRIFLIFNETFCRFNQISQNSFEFIILGVSMQPALNPSNSSSEDYVFLSTWSIKDMYVQRGDIISLISPKDPKHKLIKRVIGLQGMDRFLIK